MGEGRWTIKNTRHDIVRKLQRAISEDRSFVLVFLDEEDRPVVQGSDGPQFTRELLEFTIQCLQDIPEPSNEEMLRQQRQQRRERRRYEDNG